MVSFIIPNEVKYGMEIDPKVDIGTGFYIGHAFNISINRSIKIEKNLIIHRGAVIGQKRVLDAVLA